jgi:biotin transporter BioY
MYWFAAAAKTAPAWTSDFTAIYLALGYEHYALPFASQLRAFPSILAFMTFGVYWLEWLGPCLLFSPYLNRFARSLAAVLFIAMHVGLMVCMHLGLFSTVCVIGWLLVLPSPWWNRVEAGFRRIASMKWPPGRSLGVPTCTHSLLGWATEQPNWKLSRLTSSLVVLLTVYVIGWNVLYTDNGASQVDGIPEETRWVANLLGLNQRWNMFAPQPPTRNIRFELLGVTGNGKKIDLWTMSDHRADKSMEVNSHRWRKYLSNLADGGADPHRRKLASWAQSRWNANQQTSQERIGDKDIELVIYRKENRPPNTPEPPIRVAYWRMEPPLRR